MTTDPFDQPTSRSASWLRIARRWPYATASLIGVVVWLATSALLAELAPAAPQAIGWLGLLVGVAIGAPLAGLEGQRRWVAVPVMTLAIACIVGGLLALSGLSLP